MPKNKYIKDDKCIICQHDIPKSRIGIAITCRHDCSRKYNRVATYVKGRYNSKYQIENTKLKLKLKKRKDI